ncbi:MAG: site-specific DNA-methyltransferase, partial [Paludibacter sp.]
MTKQLQKLELTWIGKGNEPQIEPRILIEDPSKSFGDAKTENMLINGDNLLALRALEQNYSGMIKCIYIDPPYNINAAGIYEDNIEHSIWLSLMKPRLEILKNLLSRDGVIFVQIDDYEMAYLQLVLDEVFGRYNRLNTIAVKMSEASGVKMSHANKRLPKLKEYILCYKKKEDFIFSKIIKVPSEIWNDEYKTYLEDFTEEQRESLREYLDKDNTAIDDIMKVNSLLQSAKIYPVSKKLLDIGITNQKEIIEWKFKNAWRIIQAVGSSSVKNYAMEQPILNQDISALLSPTGLIYLYYTNFNRETKQPRIQILFADDNLMQNPGDFWTDIKTTGGVGQEGGVYFPNGKKPELLIQRIIELASKKGDWVLDSFLGSGTTAAVAQKLERKWIGIELGEQANTHCLPRLKSVVDGSDQSGISKAIDWPGGGGFKFYSLAPSLIQKDKYGNEIINPVYNANMLAAAMAKQEGFRYAPHESIYWKQGNSSEKD